MTRKKARTFSWMNPKLEVRKTLRYGKGIFAVEDIKKGSLLSIFGGYIITAKEESKLRNNSDGGLQITEDLVISSGNYKENSDYFNHSCEPNAGFKGQIFLVAMRKIKKNEEITFDYAMVLHRSKNYQLYKFRCFCGKKKCRKLISDDDWKSSVLRIKYRNFFQYYLQNKIEQSIKNKK